MTEHKITDEKLKAEIKKFIIENIELFAAYHHWDYLIFYDLAENEVYKSNPVSSTTYMREDSVFPYSDQVYFYRLFPDEISSLDDEEIEYYIENPREYMCDFRIAEDMFASLKKELAKKRTDE